MEENKKRPLSEEELEQVAGGVQYLGPNEWRCRHCLGIYKTSEEAELHEAICPLKSRKKNYQRLLKPIIL